MFDECFKKEMALQMRAIIYATYLSVKQDVVVGGLVLLLFTQRDFLIDEMKSLIPSDKRSCGPQSGSMDQK